MFRTKLSALKTVFNVGCYRDTIARTRHGLKFTSKLCVYDSQMILNASFARYEYTSDEWTPVAELGNLWDGASLAAAGSDIAIFRIGDEVCATDKLFTHGHAQVCEGFVEGRF